MKLNKIFETMGITKTHVKNFNKLNSGQQKWIMALLFGDFKQGKARLYNPENDSYCCLGVAAYLHDPFFKDENNNWYCSNKEPLNTLSVSSTNYYSLFGCGANSDGGYSLWYLNDQKCKSFKEIALHVLNKPENYFSSFSEDVACNPE